MRNILKLLPITVFMLLLVGCQATETTTTKKHFITNPDIETCDFELNESYGETIKIDSIDFPYSEVRSNTFNFISPCKDTYEDSLHIFNSSLKTHQIILSFDAVYPLKEMNILNHDNTITNISVYTSIDGDTYNKLYEDYEIIKGLNNIDMKDEMTKSVKLLIDDDELAKVIDDIEFTLGEGYIVREEVELTNKFFRTNGWTGADGIFTFDLNNGGDKIGFDHQTTGFIFSDTFIGEIRDNKLRYNYKMINNTFGYLNNNEMSFVWDDTEETPDSVLKPDEYIGSRARNLLDGDGLTITHSPEGLLTNNLVGTMWKSSNLNSELIIDLYSLQSIKDIYIWNYNLDNNLGVKEFELLESNDGITYSLIDIFNLDKTSGEELIAYTQKLSINTNARYLKLKITDTYSQDFVGLGKIMIINSDDQMLFGNITSTDEITDLTGNEESSRLWLQDGIVLNNKVYLFPILVKDYLNYFQVHNVGLIEMDIVDGQFDYENANYINTPLMAKTSDGGIIYFGAGVMDNRQVDGYIYVYGYKDLDGRFLTVARVTEENFFNFNEWTYFNGTVWSKDINNCAMLKADVSAELSVTYMAEGEFAGKYMLVVMEKTTSGYISYAISDTPYGDFSDYKNIYHTTEKNFLKGAFAYNAKLHPNLSTYDKLIISYNVNTNNIGALVDGRIYYPRFISMTKVNKEA